MIGVAVIAARVLHDEITSRESTGNTDGAHHRLGAGGYEAHLLETGIGSRYALGELDFRRAWSTERGAVFRGIDDRRHHFRMRVAENQRAPRGHEVEIASAVDIVDVRALAAR